MVVPEGRAKIPTRIHDLEPPDSQHLRNRAWASGNHKISAHTFDPHARQTTAQAQDWGLGLGNSWNRRTTLASLGSSECGLNALRGRGKEAYSERLIN